MKSELMYLKILIKNKINKYAQKRNIYLPEKRKGVLIKSFSELYLAQYFNEVALQINLEMSKDKKLLFKIIKNLINKKKKVVLIENARAFNDEDVKILEKMSRDIILVQNYIEKTNSLARNQLLDIDIKSYGIIIDKLDKFEKECNKYCNSEFEKIMFTITQLEKQARYINTLRSHIYNSCLVNIFLIRSGVCMDFAIALWKCLDRLNINCNVVKGIANEKYENVNVGPMYNHAWNQVKIDGNWYNIDLTWFLSQKDIKNLLVSDKEFYSNGLHHTMFRTEKCNLDYEKESIEKTIFKYRKLDNFFEK